MPELMIVFWFGVDGLFMRVGVLPHPELATAASPSEALLPSAGPVVEVSCEAASWSEPLSDPPDPELDPVPELDPLLELVPAPEVDTIDGPELDPFPEPEEDASTDSPVVGFPVVFPHAPEIAAMHPSNAKPLLRWLCIMLQLSTGERFSCCDDSINARPAGALYRTI